MQIEDLVPNTSKKPVYGLAHNLGLGGSCSVSILGRPSFYIAGKDDGRKRVGYEFGYTCRGITPADVEKGRPALPNRVSVTDTAARQFGRARRIQLLLPNLSRCRRRSSQSIRQL